ncbi:TPA: hypothetical protein NU681_002395 [Acinetobacter baumannii]|nr:hypothetical protein [Acinetobacter baumannii]
MLNILQNIPAIHVSIISVFAAFHSAFFFFAYQKLTEAKNILDSEIEFARSVSTPSSFSFNGKYSFNNEDDTLVWDQKFKVIFFEAVNIFQSNPLKNDINDKEIELPYIIESVEKLSNIFYLFFTNYPLIGSNFFNKNSTSLFKENSFDSERYFEIRRRIFFLSDLWNNYYESLTTLFNKYDQIQESFLLNEMEAEITKYKKEIESKFKNAPLSQHELDQMKAQSENIRNSFQSRVNNKKLPLLLDFFNRVKTFEERIFPEIDKSLNNYNFYNSKFKIKSTTKHTLFIILYILTVGIVIPLILTSEPISELLKSCYIKYLFEYTLLFLSFFPYYFIGIYFLRKLKIMVFD